MRTAKVVKKEKLIAIYGNTLNGMSEGFTKKEGNLLNFQSDVFEVSVLGTTGPFAVVIASSVRGDSRFIIPTDIIESIQVPTALELFKPILDRMYPGRWYYDDKVYGNQLFIWYPKLHLTNSLNIHHDIEDLVVTFTLNDQTGQIGDLRGRRYAWTDAELAYGYSHSHLNTTLKEFQSFCQGGGSVFSKFMTTMAKTNSPEEFEMFLVQLEQYLAWESVEGRPHRYIGEIKKLGLEDYNGNSDYSLYYEAQLLCKKLADRITMELPNYPDAISINSHGMPTFLLYLVDALVGRDAQNSFVMKIEQEFIQEHLIELTQERALETWDWKDKRYKRPSAGGVRRVYATPPLPTGDLAIIAAEKFNLQPRLMAEPVVLTDTSTTTVKRLNNQFWQRVEYDVTANLLSAFNEINNDGNRNTVTPQTEGDNQQRTVSADLISA